MSTLHYLRSPPSTPYAQAALAAQQALEYGAGVPARVVWIGDRT
jgi:hypothetical protein